MKINFYSSEDDYKKYINSTSYIFEKIISALFYVYLLFKFILILSNILTTFKYKMFFGSMLIFVFLFILLTFNLISKQIFRILNKLYINKNLNKLLNNFPNMIGDKNISLEDKNLIISSEETTMEFDYNKLSIIVWRKNYIDLAYNKKLLCVIPNNAFKSNEEKNRFIELLQKKNKRK